MLGSPIREQNLGVSNPICNRGSNETERFKRSDNSSVNILCC
ncbi:Uncharacterised protein [Enterobacter ludwigii]|nr:hypothetical protein SRABI45_01363 [Enterobacter ludwigii]CZU88146.1 Uncharacterised protein [Enterobacter ludwigii]SAF03529.1 Uncharacterised protein [Enterobacter ludwigii]